MMEFGHPDDRKDGVTAAVAVWVATATLHKKYGTRRIFAKQKISDMVKEQCLSDVIDDTISTHISSHCVANIEAQPDTRRNLYRVSRGMYRLYRPGDKFHPTRKHGQVEPPVSELPDGYKDLPGWYHEEYCKKPRAG